MSSHPAMKRTWLQTGGLPVDDFHAIMRAELDGVHSVEWIGGACFKMKDNAGRQVGLVQFQPPLQDRVDNAIAEATARLAAGTPKPVDIAAGDTLIRDLDFSDPIDRALAQNAVTQAQAGIMVPDPERQDPPPINLPDYDRSNHDDRPGALDPQIAERTDWSAWAWIVACAIVLLVASFFLNFRDAM